MTRIIQHFDEVVQELDRDQRATLQAEKATLEAQLRSPRPNREVLLASMIRFKGWFVIASGEAVVGAGAGAAITSALAAF